MYVRGDCINQLEFNAIRISLVMPRQKETGDLHGCFSAQRGAAGNRSKFGSGRCVVSLQYRATISIPASTCLNRPFPGRAAIQRPSQRDLSSSRIVPQRARGHPMRNSACMLSIQSSHSQFTGDHACMNLTGLSRVHFDCDSSTIARVHAQVMACISNGSA